MVMERRTLHGGAYAVWVAVLSIVFLAGSAHVSAVQAGDSPQTPRYKVIALSRITSDQGRDYLLQLGLGTVCKLPGTNAVLVTASSDQLAKAASILDVVDVNEPFAIKTIAPASASRTLPSNTQIEEVLSDISIGTFANPPKSAARYRAIIDIHGDSVIAVSPVAKLQDILLAVESGPQALKERKLASQRPEQDKPIKSPSPAEPNVAKPTTLVQQPVQPQSTTASAPQAADAGQEPSLSALLAALKPAQTDRNESRPEAKTESSPAEPVQSVAPAQPRSDAPASAKPTATPKPENASPAAEPSSTTGGPPNADETVRLNLPEKLSMVDLLGLVGPYLHLDYIYDATKLQGLGDVTLNLQGKLRGPMKVRDLYPLLESVLKFKGLVMTRKGNLVTIVRVDEYTEADPVLVDGKTAEIKTGDVIVTRIFELQHVDTTSAMNLLEMMKLSVAAVPISETGTLIVTGYAYRMERIDQLLKVIDRPGPPRRFRFRQLRYTMARTLAEKVQALTQELGAVPITLSTPITTLRTTPIRTPTPPSPIRTPLPTAPVTTPTTGKPSVYLDADERTNRILMIGLEEQLVVVDDLIDALDVEQQDLRTFHLYKIEHVDAADARKKLEELGIVSAAAASYTSTRITPTGAAAPTGAAPTPMSPAPFRTPTARTATGEAAEQALAGQPQVVVIEATNSLLVNATTEQHAQITAIISYVDSEVLAEEIPYKLYALKNQEPAKIVEVLEKLIQDVIKDKEGKIEKVIKKEEGITVVADPCTFSVIVYANKKNQDWIANLIDQLDKRRPQVLIDVTLVEISKTDDFSYDLNLLSSIPDLAATSGLTGAIATGKTSADIIEGLAATGRNRFIDLQSNKGVGTGFYGDRHIQFLLTAMQQKNYGRVLAKPKILVNDSEDGLIQTIDTTYVVKKSSVPLSTGGAGQQTTVVETAVSYEPYPAGITLNIKPHISEGDLLRLDVKLSRSDFTGATGGEKPPDTTESKVETVVTVPNGSTIILGGMIKLNQSKGGTKVPILGDLPLVGAAFRTVSNSDLQRKLYVFVKAEIIRPDDVLAGRQRDMDKISERNRTAFEQQETDFQDYHNVPGIKPKPMDPVRVLEAQ